MLKWSKLHRLGCCLLLNIIFAATALADSTVHEAFNRSIEFVALGDMPYRDAEYSMLEHPGAIAAAIQTLNPSVLIHLGDFKKSRLSCTDKLFKDRYRQIAQLNPHRTVYTPGDNDWTDCDRFNMFKRYDELERLDYLRELFFHQDTFQLTKKISNLTRQENMIENARWAIDSVVFATLHIPGTNNGREEILRSDQQKALNAADERDQLNASWLNQLFQSAQSAQAIVIAFHADIYNIESDEPACTPQQPTQCDGFRMLRELISEKALQFRKPVLVIHGDSQAYCLHQPDSQIPNLWRLNAPGDYKHIDASHIIFNPGHSTQPFTALGVLDKKPAPAVCDYGFLTF